MCICTCDGDGIGSVVHGFEAPRQENQGMVPLDLCGIRVLCRGLDGVRPHSVHVKVLQNEGPLWNWERGFSVRIGAVLIWRPS